MRFTHDFGQQRQDVAAQTESQGRLMTRSCTLVVLMAVVAMATQFVHAQATGSNSGASIKSVDAPDQITEKNNQNSAQTKRDPVKQGPRIYLSDEQTRRRLLERAKQVNDEKQQSQGARQSNTQQQGVTQVSNSAVNLQNSAPQQTNTDQQTISDQPDTSTATVPAMELTEEEQARVDRTTGADQSLQSLFRNAPGTTAEGDSESEGGGSFLIGTGWIIQTLGALGIVIALIFATRWFLMKKTGLKNAGAGRRSASGFLGFGQRGAVEVIERTSIGNKTQVVLLRVNHRVLAISQCGQQVTTLCEISDPNEVAGLIGQKTSAEENSRSHEFSNYLEEAQRGDQETASLAKLGGQDSEYLVDRARHGVSGLNGLIRNLKGKAG